MQPINHSEIYDEREKYYLQLHNFTKSSNDPNDANQTMQINVEGLKQSGLEKPVIRRAEEINKCYNDMHHELEVSVRAN